MFDAKYFRERLPNDAREKGSESADQPTVEIAMMDGSHYKVAAVCEALPGCVVVDVYPEGEPKQHLQEDRRTGAATHKVDRIALAYDSIVSVRLTLSPPSRNIGFKG